MATQPKVFYQFKIHLKGVSPMIWRRFQVRADMTIAELHYVVQLVMGWQDTHLNCFKIYGKDYGVFHSGGLPFDEDPMSIRLRDLRLRVNTKFTYEYDFSEDWQHVIRLEKILPVGTAMECPVCIAGKRACLPEDIGGPDRYDQFLADLLSTQLKVWARLGTILSDQQKLKFRMNESVELGGSWWDNLLFDPEYFNKREINGALAQLYQNKGHTLQTLQESFQQIIWTRELAW
ncbi:MAG: plasmid pRiA4b ORF-3 family protein [Bacteroidota bacterium]